MSLALTDPRFSKLNELFASYGKPATQLVARRAEKEATLEMYGAIGEQFGGASAAQFASVLNDVKDASKLTIYMSSPGGDYFEGLAIAAQLSRFAKTHDVTVVVDGIAASVASVIAISAPHVVMAPKAQMMIHEVWVPRASGNAKELMALAEQCQKATEDMVSLYATRTKRSVEDIRSMLAQGDYYMTASQAVELGFADELVGQAKQPQAAAVLDPKRQAMAARINIAARKTKRQSASR